VLRFQRPSLPSTDEIDRYLDLSREERWFSNGGPCWRLLRERLGDRVGAYCVPVASGTLGLVVALAAVLEQGGRAPTRAPVLMPSFTFIATAQAAVSAGLKPTLIDVAADHWHLDPPLLEAALEENSAIWGVVAVSAFGTPPPAETRLRWEDACRRAGLPLIVDSAAGFGAVADDGAPVGRQGDIEVVSFHATKPFAIGEGGAIFTRDKGLCERVEAAVNFGLDRNRKPIVPHGTNAKMSEIHAATALAVLDRFDSTLERRRQISTSIRERADAGVSWQRGFERSTFQFLPIALPDEEQRDGLIDLCRDDIEVRVYYEPLDILMPDRWEVAIGDLANTHDLYSRILCLPMANDLDEAEIGTLASLLSRAQSLKLG
jgi:dTDP-4-amino-4,6-dideoxygalactose transaminase